MDADRERGFLDTHAWSKHRLVSVKVDSVTLPTSESVSRSIQRTGPGTTAAAHQLAWLTQSEAAIEKDDEDE